MEKTYTCPSCGSQLLKVTTIENGKDVEKYYCDICGDSYDESELIQKDEINLIKKSTKLQETKQEKKAKKGRGLASSKKTSSGKKSIKKTKKNLKK